MDKTIPYEPTAGEPADLKAAVSQYIQQIDRVREQMASDQEEIERLKAETRVILERLKAA